MITPPRPVGRSAGCMGVEARLLRAEEARLARRADLSLLISAQEAALFRARLAPEVLADCDVQVLRNGIDSSGF